MTLAERQLLERLAAEGKPTRLALALAPVLEAAGIELKDTVLMGVRLAG